MGEEDRLSAQTPAKTAVKAFEIDGMASGSGSRSHSDFACIARWTQKSQQWEWRGRVWSSCVRVGGATYPPTVRRKDEHVLHTYPGGFRKTAERGVRVEKAGRVRYSVGPFLESEPVEG